MRPPLPPGPYLVVGLARSGRAAALALQARGEEVTGTDGGDTHIVAGTYRDRVVRTPEGWKIAERQLTVLWTQGNERVLHPARA